MVGFWARACMVWLVVVIVVGVSTGRYVYINELPKWAQVAFKGTATTPGMPTLIVHRGPGLRTRLSCCSELHKVYSTFTCPFGLNCSSCDYCF